MKTIHLLATALMAAACSAAQAGGDHGHAHGHAAAHEGKEQTDWGIAGDPRAVRRTIAVTASDAMRFTPSIIEVGEGETVKIVLRNTGKAQHELVLGTKKELDEHAALMQKFPGMEHDEPHMTHVAAGRSGSIVWTFNRPGEFDFACLVPGHYQAGMTGRIRVLPQEKHKH